jgi:hypothetical protein
VGTGDPLRAAGDGRGPRDVCDGLSLSGGGREVRAMDTMDISPELKKKFFQTNAERWFGI